MAIGDGFGPSDAAKRRRRLERLQQVRDQEKQRARLLSHIYRSELDNARQRKVEKAEERFETKKKEAVEKLNEELYQARSHCGSATKEAIRKCEDLSVNASTAYAKFVAQRQIEHERGEAALEEVQRNLSIQQRKVEAMKALRTKIMTAEREKARETSKEKARQAKLIEERETEEQRIMRELEAQTGKVITFPQHVQLDKDSFQHSRVHARGTAVVHRAYLHSTPEPSPRKEAPSPLKETPPSNLKNVSSRRGEELAKRREAEAREKFRQDATASEAVEALREADRRLKIERAKQLNVECRPPPSFAKKEAAERAFEDKFIAKEFIHLYRMEEENGKPSHTAGLPRETDRRRATVAGVVLGEDQTSLDVTDLLSEGHTPSVLSEEMETSGLFAGSRGRKGDTTRWVEPRSRADPLSRYLRGALLEAKRAEEARARDAQLFRRTPHSTKFEAKRLEELTASSISDGDEYDLWPQRERGARKPVLSKEREKEAATKTSTTTFSSRDTRRTGQVGERLSDSPSSSLQSIPLRFPSVPEFHEDELSFTGDVKSSVNDRETQRSEVDRTQTKRETLDEDTGENVEEMLGDLRKAVDTTWSSSDFASNTIGDVSSCSVLEETADQARAARKKEEVSSLARTKTADRDSHGKDRRDEKTLSPSTVDSPSHHLSRRLGPILASTVSPGSVHPLSTLADSFEGESELDARPLRPSEDGSSYKDSEGGVGSVAFRRGQKEIEARGGSQYTVERPTPDREGHFAGSRPSQLRDSLSSLSSGDDDDLDRLERSTTAALRELRRIREEATEVSRDGAQHVSLKPLQPSEEEGNWSLEKRARAEESRAVAEKRVDSRSAEQEERGAVSYGRTHKESISEGRFEAIARGEEKEAELLSDSRKHTVTRNAVDDGEEEEEGVLSRAISTTTEVMSDVSATGSPRLSRFGSRLETRMRKNGERTDAAVLSPVRHGEQEIADHSDEKKEKAVRLQNNDNDVIVEEVSSTIRHQYTATAVPAGREQNETVSLASYSSEETRKSDRGVDERGIRSAVSSAREHSILGRDEAANEKDRLAATSHIDRELLGFGAIDIGAFYSFDSRRDRQKKGRDLEQSPLPFETEEESVGDEGSSVVSHDENTPQRSFRETGRRALDEKSSLDSSLSLSSLSAASEPSRVREVRSSSSVDQVATGASSGLIEDAAGLRASTGMLETARRREEHTKALREIRRKAQPSTTTATEEVSLSTPPTSPDSLLSSENSRDSEEKVRMVSVSPRSPLSSSFGPTRQEREPNEEPSAVSAVDEWDASQERLRYSTAAEDSDGEVNHFQLRKRREKTRKENLRAEPILSSGPSVSSETSLDSIGTLSDEGARDTAAERSAAAVLGATGLGLRRTADESLSYSDSEGSVLAGSGLVPTERER